MKSLILQWGPLLTPQGSPVMPSYAQTLIYQICLASKSCFNSYVQMFGLFDVCVSSKCVQTSLCATALSPIAGGLDNVQCPGPTGDKKHDNETLQRMLIQAVRPVIFFGESTIVR